MGCDLKVICLVWVRLVSIHAPVWGATGFGGDGKHTNDVSIHAPVWGATRVITYMAMTFWVSIHAPVWGATNPCPDVSF